MSAITSECLILKLVVVLLVVPLESQQYQFGIGCTGAYVCVKSGLFMVIFEL
jgi:hypothetical protein